MGILPVEQGQRSDDRKRAITQPLAARRLTYDERLQYWKKHQERRGPIARTAVRIWSSTVNWFKE